MGNYCGSQSENPATELNTDGNIFRSDVNLMINRREFNEKDVEFIIKLQAIFRSWKARRQV
jgi:hypothetical protein